MAKITKGYNMRTFKELYKIGKQYYKDSNFCTIIAISSVCDISFGKARAKMMDKGRLQGKGALQYQYHRVIEDRGFNVDPVYGYEGHHVRTMGKKLGKGKFLVNVRGHVLAVVDGVINDWTEERSLRVREVYKVTKIG